MRKKPSMDGVDLAILRLLQSNAKISVDEIGAGVGLSHTPVWRRIDKLQKAGVIQGTRTQLNRSAFDLGLTVFLSLKLSRHDEKSVVQFEEAVKLVPEVLECHSMSGGWDYLLKIVVESVETYETFLKRKVLNLPHVNDLLSNIALREVSRNEGLPI
jgi:Lrp/AsnC family transcriptional regulator